MGGGLIWRTWSLLAGLPLGALAAWAIAGPGSAVALAAGAAAGGLALVAAVSILDRRMGGERARRIHLAAGASVGWIALPALLASALRLGPAPGWQLAGVAALLGVALFRGARRSGAFGVGRLLVSGALTLVLGTIGVVGMAGLVAASGPGDPEWDEQRAAALFDLDAAVATRPLPRCASAPAQVRVLRDAGAHPRLGADGRMLWFDAEGPEGRRQIHRLDRTRHESVCWTCGEPGNNVRPAPGNRASGVVFDTDRHATGWDPSNTELHLVTGRGDGPPPPSRRLSYHPGPDEHAILARGTGLLIWSRGTGGGYRVVSAPVRSAHGGLMLGAETLLAFGGSQWTAPLAWSPDARSLVVMRGNPFRPLPAALVDFAGDRRSVLAADAAGPGAVSFSADGGWVAVATSRRARLTGLLPAGLGFALAAFATRAAESEVLFRGTGLRTGEAWGEKAELDLGDAADWGEPTGVALAPDGQVLVVGQRRTRDGAVSERLLEITLDCRGRPS